MYSFFVTFIVFGSFFTLNLIIGVILDKFNEVKNRSNSPHEDNLTDAHKKVISAMRRAGRKNLVKALPRPRWAPQAVVFAIITNKKFDAIMMGIISLNMVSIEHASS